MDYRIALCDDEKWERERLSHYLTQYAAEYGVRISIDEFSSGEALLQGFLMGERHYDIVFLDVEMGGVDLLWLQKSGESRITR